MRFAKRIPLLWSWGPTLLACLGCPIPGTAGCWSVSRQESKASLDNGATNDYAQQLSVLKTSKDRSELEKAALSLANSGNAEAHRLLGDFLRSGEFLARLDDLTDTSTKTRHLGIVLNALASHFSSATEKVCLALAEDAEFSAIEERKIFLLPALAAVKPMSTKTVEFLSRSNQEGYFSTNAPLLVKNGSPLALELFQSMIQDRNTDAKTRVDALHYSVLPYRTQHGVLQTCERLLFAGLEDEVAIGIIETLFDFQYKRWFGPASNAPTPPPWKNASDKALELVLRLAEKARERENLPSALVEAVNRTVDTIGHLQVSRRK